MPGHPPENDRKDRGWRVPVSATAIALALPDFPGADIVSMMKASGRKGGAGRRQRPLRSGDAMPPSLPRDREMPSAGGETSPCIKTEATGAPGRRITGEVATGQVETCSGNPRICPANSGGPDRRKELLEIAIRGLIGQAPVLTITAGMVGQTLLHDGEIFCLEIA